MKDFSEKFENGGGKVKGFRNWTQSMEVDLIETKAKVLKGLFFIDYMIIDQLFVYFEMTNLTPKIQGKFSFLKMEKITIKNKKKSVKLFQFFFRM